MITYLQHLLLRYVSSISRLVSFFLSPHSYDERLGGYVAADITALVAEAISSAASSSGSHHHHNDNGIDHDYDYDSVNDIAHEEGGSGKQHHFNPHSSERSNYSNQGPVTGSNTVTAPSPSPSPSSAEGVLLEIFSEAMNAVPPSCLRGLALQLPDVRSTALNYITMRCVSFTAFVVPFSFSLPYVFNPLPLPLLR